MDRKQLFTRAVNVGAQALSIIQKIVNQKVTRPSERLLRRGPWRQRHLDFERDRIILLFYEDFDGDRYVKGDRHAVRALRRLVQSAKDSQKVTGFGVVLEFLKKALEGAGYTVRENDLALAQANPDYPVGILGYPHVFDYWQLSNPSILGPGLFDHPALCEDIAKKANIMKYLVSSDWMRNLFSRAFPYENIGIQFAGIDTDLWSDTKAESKDLDFILYQKILWGPDTTDSSIIDFVADTLTEQGYSYDYLVYRHYDHEGFRRLLRRARGMIFLCEHETQGIAYQEAMASNVPILAWDRGEWLDPVRLQYDNPDIPASSIPHFDETCGERFKQKEEFPAALKRFMDKRETYTPRQYVLDNLSLEKSAESYVSFYKEAWARSHRT